MYCRDRRRLDKNGVACERVINNNPARFEAILCLKTTVQRRTSAASHIL
jgi:hypothetical protein